MATSLKDRARDIIINQVFRLSRGPPTEADKEKFRVLVADRYTVRILSACLRMYDVVNENITLVESLEKGRRPLPRFEAIYFVSPTREAVARICNDFKEDKLYASVRIFFNDACPDELVSMLSAPSIARVLEGVTELSLSFIAQEDRVFHLDDPNAIYSTFSPHASGSFNYKDTAARVAAVCTTLGGMPVVRYEAGSRDTVCAQLAKDVQERLDFLAQFNDDLKVRGGQARSQLIIVDRSADLLSMLLHEFTYQAAAYDMTDIPNDVFKYTYTDGAGRQQQKEAVLNDQDELWVRHRHQHMAVAFDQLSKDFAAFAQRRPRDKDGLKVEDIRKAMRDLPQHQQIMSKFSLHTELSQCINQAFTRMVEKIADAEQCLAMGETPDGTPVNDFLGLISNFIVDRSVSEELKTRLIIAFLVVNGGVSARDLKRILDDAHLSATFRDAVTNSEFLGVMTDSAKRSRRKNKTKRVKRDFQYDLSRWTPLVKDLMENACTNKLDLKTYPCIRDAPTGGGAEEEEAVVSVRKKASWTAAKKGKSGASAGAAAAAGGSSGDSRPYIVVFVTGGISYSEMRCAYEVSEAMRDWDVFIGGPACLTPKKFLDNMAGLSQPPAASHEVIQMPADTSDVPLQFVRGQSRPAFDEDMV